MKFVDTKGNVKFGESVFFGENMYMSEDGDGRVTLNTAVISGAAVYSSTYIATARQFGGVTKEQTITNTIAAAVANGIKYVFIPQVYDRDGSAMMPYNASLVTFNTSVHVVREGGDSSTFEAQAYGATGNGVYDDTPSLHAIINAATPKGLRSYIDNGREVPIGWVGSGFWSLPQVNMALNDPANDYAVPSLAPVVLPTTNPGIDVLAHWYNDFGVEFDRVTGGNGITWYDWAWEWNGVNDPQRRPSLGWYHGDAPTVLDWQTYWLLEAGVTGAILTATDALDTSAWTTATNKNNWVYQLMTAVPAFRGMQYVLWGKYSGTLAEITAQWTDLINNVYLKYPNVYCVRKDGKLYPVIYVFEGGTLFTNVGNTEATQQAFFYQMRDLVITSGVGYYGGVAIFLRHPKSDTSLSRATLEANDVLVFDADYSNGCWLNIAGNASLPIFSDATTYTSLSQSWSPLWEHAEWTVGSGYAPDVVVKLNGWLYIARTTHTSTVDDEPFVGKNQSTNWFRLGPINRQIPNLKTSSKAVAPHPSENGTYWKAAGSTPELFRLWLQRVVDSAQQNKTAPIVTIYNVSEWAEGGPGLQPDYQDGFGYLDAVKDVITRLHDTNTTDVLPVPSSIQARFISATSTLLSEFDELQLTTDAPRTLTATPTIDTSKAQDGQRIRLTNVNTSSTNSITLQDDSVLAGSKLFLQGDAVVLRRKASVELVYSSRVGGWVQVGRPLTSAVVTLTDAGTISVNVERGTTFEVTLGGNRTMGAPFNGYSGQIIYFTIIQDGTGGRTLGWNAIYKQTWSNAGNLAGNRSSIGFAYDGTNWNQIGDQSPYVYGLFSTITSANLIASGTFQIDGPAGSVRDLILTTSNVRRWHVRADSTAEAGSNAGSNLTIRAYDDAGTAIDDVVTILRLASGTMTVTRPVTTGTPVTISDPLNTRSKLDFKFTGTREAGIDVAGPNTLRFYDTLDTVKFQHKMSGNLGQLVPPSVSYSIRNNADNADNVLVNDVGTVVVRDALTAGVGATGAAVGTRYRTSQTLFLDGNLSTGSTTDVSLTSFTLLSGTLGATPQLVRITMAGNCNTNATPNIVFSGTSAGRTLISPANTVTSGTAYYYVVTVQRSGAATIRCVSAQTHGTTVNTDASGSLAYTLGSDQKIDFRGSVGAGGTLRVDTAMVEYLTAI